MDIQEINIGESTTIPKLNVIENESSGLNGKKSVNFGPGADLLMNPKKQNQTPNTKSDMELSDINEIDIGGNSLKEARNSILVRLQPLLLFKLTQEPAKILLKIVDI